MILVRTPLRVSLLGGSSDVPAHYREHGGAVVGTTIDRYSYVSVLDLPAFGSYGVRASYSRVERVERAAELAHPVMREVLTRAGVERGLEVNYAADLPTMMGLGSSSALTVGLLHAMHARVGGRPEALALAREAIDMEQDILGERVGSQDQCWAALGGLRLIEFGPDDEIRSRSLEPGAGAQLAAHLLLAFTGTQRRAHEIHEQQWARTADNRGRLDELAALAREGAALLARTGVSMEALGRLVTAGWELKRGLSPAVSNDAVDAAHRAALAAGALGGKLLGAGGGGCLLFLVPPDRVRQVSEAVAPMPTLGVGLAPAGSEVLWDDPPGRRGKPLPEARRAGVG